MSITTSARRIVSGLAAILFIIALTYIPAAKTPTVHADPASCGSDCWDIIPSPDASGSLEDVSAASADAVWTVGRGAESLIFHWDGTSWANQALPAIELNHGLFGVSAFSSSDVWAVGYQNDNPPPDTPSILILHYGSANPGWIQSSGPNPGAAANVLNTVATFSSSEAWAAGYYSNIEPSGIYYTLVERTTDNGATWQVVPSPNLGVSDIIQDIAGTSSNDIWAVGQYWNDTAKCYQTLSMHWNGAVWSIVPSPNLSVCSSLQGVTAIAPNDVWAVGTAGDPATNDEFRFSLTMHWDGSNWTIVPSQNPGDWSNPLYAVAHVDHRYVPAVGFYNNNNEPFLPLNERWDGAEWVNVPMQVVDATWHRVNAIAVVPGTSLAGGGTMWAVGSSNYSQRPLIERYRIPADTRQP